MHHPSRSGLLRAGALSQLFRLARPAPHPTVPQQQRPPARRQHQHPRTCAQVAGLGQPRFLRVDPALGLRLLLLLSDLKGREVFAELFFLAHIEFLQCPEPFIRVADLTALYSQGGLAGRFLYGCVVTTVPAHNPDVGQSADEAIEFRMREGLAQAYVGLATEREECGIFKRVSGTKDVAGTV